MKDTKFPIQLTEWVNDETDIYFAINQLNQYGGKPYRIKHRIMSGGEKAAIFVEGELVKNRYISTGKKNLGI